MSRFFKNILKVAGLCAAAFILCLVISAYLPALVQNTLHNIFSKNNLPISLNVLNIGLWGSNFSGLAIGAGKPLARVDSIRLDYSPASLWQKKINRIALAGVTVNLVFEDGRLTVPWQTAKDGHTGKDVSEDIRDYQLDYLYNLGEISINQVVLNIFYNNKYFTIPCTLNVQTSADNSRLLVIRATLMVRGQQVMATAEIDLDSLEMRAAMTADSVDLLRFADLLPGDGLSVAGRLGLKAETLLDLNPLRLLSAKLSGRLGQTDIGLGAMRISNINSPDEINSPAEQPFLFNLTADNDTVHLTSTYLSVNGSPGAEIGGAEIGGLDLSLTRSEKGASLAGEFTVNIPAQKGSAPFAMDPPMEPLRLVTAVHGEIDKDGGWSIRAAAANKNMPLVISRSGSGLSARISDYTLSGFGKAAQAALTYSLSLSSVSIDADGISIKLPEFTAQGQTSNGSSKFVLPFENLSFRHNNSDISGVASGRIQFSRPYQPGPENNETVKSEILLEDLRLADMNLGSLRLSLGQEQQGFTVAGRYQAALFDNFCIELTGQADFLSARPAAEIKFHNACDRSFKGLELGRFTPGAAGYLADAELNLNGNIRYENGRLAGEIDTKIENIRLFSREKDFTLEGGILDIQMTELPGIKTGPKQRFSFEHLRFGKIIADHGLVEFQIESAESIFIEKSGVQWSDGHVYTQAFRFSPKINDYELIFYCDRLNFAELLEQLGAASAEGQGRVNGRVPVRITDGRFFLENGFLYSTPGEGGTIRLTEANILKAGIPRNSPQFAQIDLAIEALKDFAYDWTKLDINSQADGDLLLHLQVNGKPAKPLPFVYSKEFGGFVRVDASSPGSRFQGIKLDVNFRLPLNQILSYGDTIKSLVQ